MTTVNLQNNPDIPITGSRDADAVIITSEIVDANLTEYQIEKIVTGDVYSINSDGTGWEGSNVVDVTKAWLKIILESRTKYRVRTRAQHDAWGPWVNFTTRDKRYQSPGAISDLTTDADSSAQTQGTKVDGNGHNVVQGGNRTIVVTNNAKAIETDNAAAGYNQPRNWGAATIHNTDTIFNDGQLQTSTEGKQVPVLFTDRGATVVNVPAGQNASITFTDAGATVNTVRS